MKKELLQEVIRVAITRGCSHRVKITFKQDAAKGVVHLLEMEKTGIIKLNDTTDNGMIDLMDARDTGRWNHDDHRTIVVTLAYQFFNEGWFVNKLSPNLEKIEVVE
ncbi:MAG: hypothetical protein WC609_02465 [Candidatus Paceibacterota bacterium]|jgi:hypothetical protein